MQARDKNPKDAMDISQMLKVTTDAIARIGAANFELNMRRREQIKLELNERPSLHYQKNKKEGRRQK